MLILPRARARLAARGDDRRARCPAVHRVRPPRCHRRALPAPLACPRPAHLPAPHPRTPPPMMASLLAVSARLLAPPAGGSSSSTTPQSPTGGVPGHRLRNSSDLHAFGTTNPYFRRHPCIFPCAPRSLGSTRSLRASPSMLNPKTAPLIASPGQTAIQGAVSR